MKQILQFVLGNKSPGPKEHKIAVGSCRYPRRAWSVFSVWEMGDSSWDGETPGLENILLQILCTCCVMECHSGYGHSESVPHATLDMERVPLVEFFEHVGQSRDLHSPNHVFPEGDT